MNVLEMNGYVDHLLVQIYREIINVIVIFFIRENDVKIVREDFLRKLNLFIFVVSGVGLFVVIISSIVVILIIAFLILFGIRTLVGYRLSRRVSKFV
jgi:hypothetical protein